MKRIIRILAMALALLGPVALTVTTTGCKTTGPASAEVATYKSIKASDIAVEAAIRAWAQGYARREAANERTRSDDPGGYLDRRAELVKEHGRVVDLRGRYSAAVQLVVETWIRAKQTGATAPPEPVATAEVVALQRQIESLTR